MVVQLKLKQKINVELKEYSNTGKPVIVVGHSYGTLLALTNLVRTENKDLLPKIKKFVAIVPSFAGSYKLLDIFLHGLDDWNKSFKVLIITIVWIISIHKKGLMLLII